ncbi:MAG: YabP/YqfC family sporulation protein [Oscillospiraceae bacterium]|nr:YabP/YqfC family sporulation protein [Oscillospiraceae bacterium]
MGIREKLIEFEELSQKKCTVTLVTDGGLRNGAELCVENCRCVKNCDDNFIVLSVFGMDIHVSGAPLVFENFGIGGVKITGKIHSLTFEEN